MRFARLPKARFARFFSLNVSGVSLVMDGEKTLERRIQLRGRSFVLTIPRAVIEKMKIRNGQSVRFLVGDGEVVIRPMSAETGDWAADSAEPDKYARAIEEMMAKNESEKSGGRGAASGRSKLERLRS